VDGSGTAPLSATVRLGTGLISDKLVMICSGNKHKFVFQRKHMESRRGCDSALAMQTCHAQTRLCKHGKAVRHCSDSVVECSGRNATWFYLDESLASERSAPCEGDFTQILMSRKSCVSGGHTLPAGLIWASTEYLSVL